MWEVPLSITAVIRDDLKESTQLGAELIGIDSVEADAEMIAMVVDGLEKSRTQRISGEYRACGFPAEPHGSYRTFKRAAGRNL